MPLRNTKAIDGYLHAIDMEYKTTNEEQMTFKSPKQINFDDFDVYTTSISSFFIFFYVGLRRV